jgi:hypothetical protein
MVLILNLFLMYLHNWTYIYLHVYRYDVMYKLCPLTCSFVKGIVCNEKWRFLYPVVCELIPLYGSDGIWNKYKCKYKTPLNYTDWATATFRRNFTENHQYFGGTFCLHPKCLSRSRNQQETAGQSATFVRTINSYIPLCSRRYRRWSPPAGVNQECVLKSMTSSGTRRKTISCAFGLDNSRIWVTVN